MNYYQMFNIRLVNPRNTENIYRCIYENQTEINDFLNKGCKIFYKFFYGETITKITGMNFCSYVGCV